MASGYERLGQARRGIIDNQKKTNMITGILGTISTIYSFAKGQADKADTAWDEYEAGYKEIPGADIANIPKKSSFFKQLGQTLIPGGNKGFFEMPEGEVTIGNKIYDREQIRKVGSVLGTEAGQLLDENIRKSYIERTIPGRDISEPIVDTGVGTSFDEFDDPYKERNVWESLEENNKRRKIFYG